jgi:hypothetical protein
MSLPRVYWMPNGRAEVARLANSVGTRASSVIDRSAADTAQAPFGLGRLIDVWETERLTDLFPLTAIFFPTRKEGARRGLRAEAQSLSPQQKNMRERGNSGLDGPVFSVHGCDFNQRLSTEDICETVAPRCCVSLRPRFRHHRATQVRARYIRVS